MTNTTPLMMSQDFSACNHRREGTLANPAALDATTNLKAHEADNNHQL